MPRRARRLLSGAMLAAFTLLPGTAAASGEPGDAAGGGAPPPMPSILVGATFFPWQELRHSETGGRVGEVRITTRQLDVSYPITANEGRTRLELSAAYQKVDFDYRGFDHPLESVQSIGVTAFLRQQLSDRWGLILVAAPGYADDFEGKASLDALTSTFVAAGSRRFSRNLEIGFGAAIQNAFGEPLPLPVASVDWTITDRLWLKSILPVNAELTWLPVDRLGLRASLLVNGSNYHGSERIYGVNNPQLNYSSVAADFAARWFCLPFLHLTAHAGTTLHRRFEFSEGRDPVEGGTFDLANGPTFGLDLGVGN